MSGKNNFLSVSENKRNIWRQFVSIAKPYWFSEKRWQAFGMLGVLILLLLAVNGLNVVINYVGGAFMTALSGKDQPTFYRMLMIYFSVFVVGTPIVVLYGWVADKLGLMWRTWITDHMLDKYLANRNYYRISNDASIDNPDERLAQDLNDFTRQALSLALNFLSSAVQLLSFITILWSISHKLVGIVFFYALFGTLATVFMGRRLVGLKFNQLRKEANFRYNLIHVRNNVESIAFYQGEESEKRNIRERFMDAVSNFNALIGWQRNLGFLTTGYNYMVVLIPALIIAPLYFAGKVPFGAETQADMAFGQILAALSLVVTSFDSITAFTAQVKRIGAFNDGLEASATNCSGTIESTIAPKIELEDVTLLTPNCVQTLMTHVTTAVAPGTGLLLMGPSGSGKSSLLRAIGGLWNNGHGRIVRPDLKDMLFLPQRPYMPLGSLREQMLYPHGDPKTTDAQLQAMLDQVHLPDLAKRVGGFETVLSWADVLSLGEQQRLAFARLLLAHPAYAILDEATSALDVKNEENLYRQLEASGTTYISVGHRPTLKAYHHNVLELTGDGGWRIYPADQQQQ
jgi:putative ATP-binding cassette transporter